MQQVLGYVFGSVWLCVSSLRFLGWVITPRYNEGAESWDLGGDGGRGSVQHLLGRRHRFRAGGGRGPPLGLRGAPANSNRGLCSL